MPSEFDPKRRQCTLLLYAATPAEEKALGQIATERFGLGFEKIRDPILGEYHWMGEVGSETVIAIRPAREAGQVVMGDIGRLGSAARGIRFRDATGARAIVQIGMAFGVDRRAQKLGDVVISTSLIPYDNRRIGAVSRRLFARLTSSVRYATDYSPAVRQPAHPGLIEMFDRERRRSGDRAFGVHPGAVLSGAARIQSRFFRDELVANVPGGDDRIVGGEMEGVGLLAASTESGDPVWCIAKGISDFADENRDSDLDGARAVACRNSAEFVLAALVNNVNP